MIGDVMMNDLFQYAKLVKFVKSHYSEEIMNGKLYCNTLNYFRKTIYLGGQNDQYEGIAYHYINPNQRIKIEADGTDTCIFCVSLLTPKIILDDSKRGFYKLSEEARRKFKRFGESSYTETDCITILNPDKFIQRIEQACDNLNVRMCCCKVEYGDRNYPSPQINNLLAENHVAALFIKPTEYAWQEEYRFVFSHFTEKVKRESSGAFVLDIGNISDIAYRVEHCFI